MSSAESPELRALAELEAIIRNLADEMAAWRRRALKAEALRTELGVDHDAVAARERIIELEESQADLNARLGAARELVEQLADRLSFLEEQVGLEEQAR